MANTFKWDELLNARKPYPVGLKYNVLAGADVDVDIPVTGITTEDKIISCVHVVDATVAVTDVTSEVTITAGNVHLSTSDKTGNYLMLSWYDKN